MKEICDILTECERRHDRPLALATLVRTRGSSYRRPGARMLIADDGTTVGVLSGGCLEEEVVIRARAVFATGQPLLLSFDTRLRYGCHGSIDVFIEKAPIQELGRIVSALEGRRRCQLATTFADSNSLGSFFFEGLPDAGPGTFVQTIIPSLRLVLIGRGPDSSAMRSFARTLGWQITEAEDVATLPNEFDEWTAVVVKTHNYGRDYAALARLLPLGLPYVALLGPRRRRDQLFHALADAGVLMRSQVFAPAGLDIGAESPEEIALTIVAEIQATFAGGKAERLRARKGPIHSTTVVSESVGSFVDFAPVGGSLSENWRTKASDK